MPKLKYLFIAMIFSGLVLAEAVPIWSKLASPAESQRRLTTDEQTAIMAIFKGTNDTTLTNTLAFSGNFVNFSIPPNPGDISQDAIRSSSLMGGSAQMFSFTPNSSTSSSLISDILQGVLPPIGSPLYYAYQDGGRAWYNRGDNVLVIYSDQTIHGFSKKTGQTTIWMQDRLAYPPITDPDAYVNYQKNYNAEIVAETTQWVLMEFPSGGLVKVMKPQYATTNTTGTVSGLPNILPGYGN